MKPEDVVVGDQVRTRLGGHAAMRIALLKAPMIARRAIMNSPAQRPAQLRGPDGMVVSNVSGLKTLSTAGPMSALTDCVNGRTLLCPLPLKQ